MVSDRFQGIEGCRLSRNTAEDDELSVELPARDKVDKELRGISVGTIGGHSEHVGVIEDSLQVLISERSAVYGFSTSTVIGGDVTTLSHELRENSVKGAALVAEGFPTLSNALFTSAESAKIFRSQGTVIEEFEFDSAGRLTIDVDVKEYF